MEGFTSEELQFFLVRAAFVAACKAILGVSTEKEVYSQMPDFSEKFQAYWYSLTGKEGVY